MPKGKGTYGTKKGRPPKKWKPWRLACRSSGSHRELRPFGAL